MPPTRPTVLLIGLRGSGKSTLGAALASRLGAPFADLDRDVLERLGARTVREAWDAAGEPAFRAAETGALEARLSERGMVVALGGGTPTAPGAADLIRGARTAGAARVVYLRAAPGALRTRLASDDPDRPSLTGGDPLAEIGRVHAARDGLYRELADAVIDASGAPERVGSEMLDVVRGWWGDQAAME